MYKNKCYDEPSTDSDMHMTELKQTHCYLLMVLKRKWEDTHWIGGRE